MTAVRRNPRLEFMGIFKLKRSNSTLPVLVVITFAFLIFYYIGMATYSIICIGLLALFSLVQIVFVFAMRQQTAERRRLISIMPTVVTMAIWIGVVTNVRTIDYMVSYARLYLFESDYLDQVNRFSTGKTFLYQRFYFGRAGDGKRWLVYDQSRQMQLGHLKRTSEWWLVSGEAQESESCTTPAKILISNFFLIYSNCK